MKNGEIEDVNKYSDKSYLEKIAPLNYLKYIYDCFHLETKNMYIKCELLNLPILNLNGYAEKAPNGTPIIVIDYFLEGLLYLINHSIYSFEAIQKNTIDFEQDKIDMSEFVSKDLLSPITSFLDFYTKGGTKGLNFSEFPKKYKNLNSDVISFSRVIMLFVICHEQAHHELGHTNVNRNELIENDIQLAIKQIKKQELEADKLGIQLMFKCSNENSELNLFKNIIGYKTAPLFFFKILEFLEKEKKQKTLLYPNASERFENLKNIYMNYCTIEEFEGINEVLDFYYKTCFIDLKKYR